MCTAASSSETNELVATLPDHTYRVKINTNKSDFIIHTLHHFKGKCESILAMKLTLMESFPDDVPTTSDFQVGYLEGKQSSKRWLVCPEDLESMYSSVWPGSEISVGCDARQKAVQKQPPSKMQHKEQHKDGEGQSVTSSRKRTASNREERELEINSLKAEIKKSIQTNTVIHRCLFGLV